MIPDQIIIFIVMVLLTYIFGNRLLPQLTVIVLSFVEIISIAPSINTDITFVYYLILFAVNILYAISALLLINNKED